MTKHHWTHREPHWKRGIVINGIGAVLSFVVTIVVAITKFTHGAWFIILIIPLLVALLVRLNRQYQLEEEQLEEDAEASISAPILRRHVVLVFVNRLDMSTARAIQYARTLMPDELRAVHIAVDRTAAQHLADRWRTLGLSRVPLELVDCPDRRVDRAAVEVVAAELDGTTEVTVLLPHRVYSRLWHRLLHDNTANEIAGVVGKLPHANVTTVPFHFEPRPPKHPRPAQALVPGEPAEPEAK